MNADPKHQDLNDEEGGVARRIFALNLHPNPRYYKYRWRVFHLGSVEGREFFDTEEISTHAAITLMDELFKKGEGYFVYNRSAPRLGKNTPFDLTHKKWANCTPAPAYEDDDDPSHDRHK